MATMKTYEVNSRQREELLDVTESVREAVRQSGAQSGICVVHSPHTTAAVTLQENSDPDVRTDLLGQLGKLVPQSSFFRHGEGNSDAHIKTCLIGNSVTLLIDEGKPLLGHWQAVYFCEFDGPRQRRIHVQILGQ